MANLHCIETRAFLEGADKVVIPFGIWEHNEGISRYRNRVKAVCGSKSCGHIVGDRAETAAYSVIGREVRPQGYVYVQRARV